MQPTLDRGRRTTELPGHLSDRQALEVAQHDDLAVSSKDLNCREAMSSASCTASLRCGIYTHHQRRSNPREYGVNVACLVGVSPFDLEEVPVMDGENHPSDGAPRRLVGVLRFVPEAHGSVNDPAHG